MARISGTSGSAYRISRFLGLNEAPDGDTSLKMGEAAEMRNWRVTDAGNLVRRPGTRDIAVLSPSLGIHIDPEVLYLKEMDSSTFECTAYSSVSVGDGGLLVLSGTSGTLTYNTWHDYLNYYIQDLDGGVWKFSIVNHETDADPYLWYFCPVLIDETQSTADCVKALWSGNIGGSEVLVAAASGVLWSLEPAGAAWRRTSLGSCGTGGPVSMFGFGGKLYILAGGAYKVWDGHSAAVPEVDTLTLTSGASAAGTVTITLDGASQTLDVAADDTDLILAQKIYYNLSFPGWTVSWTLGDGGRIVFAKQIGDEVAAPSFDAGGTGVGGSFDRTTVGKTAIPDVTGYVPVVAVGVAPSGGGTALEQVNKLTPQRRCRFSPDGTSKLFVLPDTDVKSIDNVMNLTMTAPSPLSFTADTAGHRAVLATAPPQGINSVEVTWTSSEVSDPRLEVTAMKYAELYNGSTDSRVFLYGDGSNRALYSGLDYDGKPAADYFPDLNFVDVGEDGTPLTALIRHYGNLAAFKTDSAWLIRYDYTTLSDGTVTATFFTNPIHRSLGNTAPGQAQLVLNSPRTLCAGGVYEWRNGSAYASNLTMDERQAARISDRTAKTLSGFDLASCVCWDDNLTQEYYVVCGSEALVHNYAADVWYIYSDFPATCFARRGGTLFIGTPDGHIREVSDQYTSDCGEVIDAYWESGSMAFGAEDQQKSVNELYITSNPASFGSVTVAASTDTGTAGSALISYFGSGGLDFSRWDFGALSFRADAVMPHSARVVMHLKFMYMKLLFQNHAAGTNASVLSALISVNTVGRAK